MSVTNLPIVLRILDNENKLSERADQKSISMLSILGVFMVFFIVHYRVIPINVFTLLIIMSYFFFALFSIVNLIMAIRPRIRKEPIETETKNKSVVSCDPAFFTGICTFPNPSAYKDALAALLQDESQVADVYVRQIFSVAQINSAKYKFVQRGMVTVIFTLVIELAMIAYLFFYYREAGQIPPIG
jgi:hypothetical protein